MSKTVRTRTVKGYMKGYSNKSLSRFLDRLVTINHVEGKDNSKNSKLAANLTYVYVRTLVRVRGCVSMMVG